MHLHVAGTLSKQATNQHCCCDAGVEALSFKERGTFHRPRGRASSQRSAAPLSSIADAEITVDFHLEQKDLEVGGL